MRQSAWYVAHGFNEAFGGNILLLQRGVEIIPQDLPDSLMLSFHDDPATNSQKRSDVRGNCHMRIYFSQASPQNSNRPNLSICPRRSVTINGTQIENPGILKGLPAQRRPAERNGGNFHGSKG